MTFKFKGNETVENLSVVPGEYHGLYAKGADGKFTLIDAAKGIASAYDGVAAQLDQTRTALSQTQGREGNLTGTLNAWKALFTKHGVALEDSQNPVEVMDAHLTNAAKGAKGAVDLDRVRQEHTRAVQQIETKHTETVQKKDRLIQKYLINNALTSAISEAKGDVKFLPHFLAPQLKVFEEGEDLVVRVVDPSNPNQARTDGKGGLMDVKGLVEVTKQNPEYAKFFDSEQPAGTGHRPGASKTPAANGRQRVGAKDPSEMSGVENIMAGLEKGQYQKGAGGAPTF